MFASIRKRVNQDLEIAFIYSVGDFLVIGSRFALFLIYGSILTTSEYGMFAVVTAISVVAGIFITMGLKAAAFKHYFDSPTLAEKQSLYSTLWLFLTIGSGILTFLIGFLWGLFPTEIFDNIPQDPYINLTLWSSYFSNVFSLIAFETLRASRKPYHYISLAFGNAATLVLLAIIFVSSLKLGVIGALLASLCTGIIWAFIYTFSLRNYLRFKFSSTKLIKALAYSLPFVPHFLSHWLLNFSDRLILEQSVSLDQVGIYSLGYNIGTAQQVVVTSGNIAIMPYYGSAANNISEGKRLPHLYSTYILIMATFALSISIFSDEGIRLLFSDRYFQAADIVFWVVLGFFSVALYYGPMNAVTLLAGKSKYVWIFTLIAGIVNISLNLLFIPRFGIVAAAVNTLIGYLIMFILIFLYSRRSYPMSYESSRLIQITSGLILGVIADRFLNPQAIWGEIGIDIAILLLFILLVVFRNKE